ncbi:MAG: alpha/beta fold hydrolase, partial [Gemmataceae bacterium]
TPGFCYRFPDCYFEVTLELNRVLPLIAVALMTLPRPGLADTVPVVVEKDIVYGMGGDVDLQLDMARPKEGKGPFPCIVCIHGGGWRYGHRRDLTMAITRLAENGFVAVTVSYRLVPKATFPGQIEDCKAAVRWLRAHAKEYQIDPDHIGAVGLSAGGHLACLLGATDKNDGLEGKGGNPEQSSRVQAVVSFFGPTDLAARTWAENIEKPLIEPWLGGPFTDKADVYKKASPINYVTKDDPPFLFFHGDKDRIVDVSQSKLMDEKLKATGCDSRVVILEGAAHGWTGKQLDDTINQTIEFFREKLKK